MTGDKREIDELTKVAIDYATKANADILDMMNKDGFTRSDQAAYIMAMTCVHLTQLHLLRCKEHGSRPVALTHQRIIADLIDAAKAWL